MTALSRRLQQFIWLVGSVMAAAAILRWVVGDDLRAWLPPTLAADVPRGALGLGRRVAGFCIELIPLSAALYSLLALHRICDIHRAGQIVGARLSTMYRAFGRGLMLLGVANALYTPLIAFALTFPSIDGGVTIAVGLSTADLYLLVAGAAVMMLGLVVEEAHRIETENAQII